MLGRSEKKVGRESYLSDIIRLTIKFRTSKLIAGGDNVAVVYGVIVAGLTTPALGWFAIRDGMVASLRTAFDPRPTVRLLESQSPRRPGPETSSMAARKEGYAR
jgi:hypothetical protein